MCAGRILLIPGSLTLSGGVCSPSEPARLPHIVHSGPSLSHSPSLCCPAELWRHPLGPSFQTGREDEQPEEVVTDPLLPDRMSTSFAFAACHCSPGKHPFPAAGLALGTLYHHLLPPQRADPWSRTQPGPEHPPPPVLPTLAVVGGAGSRSLSPASAPVQPQRPRPASFLCKMGVTGPADLPLSWSGERGKDTGDAQTAHLQRRSF